MKNKVIVSTSKAMCSSGMKFGDFAIVTCKGTFCGHVIVRNRTGSFTSLTDASVSWTSDAEMSVEILPKGTVITLTVGSDTE